MTVERGQWFESKYAHYATAALHPAYVLRQDSQGFESCKTQLIEDIGAARKKVIEAKKEAPPSLF
jgi:hypothetical protein